MTISSTIKATREVQFLLDLEFPGATKRYATKDLSVDDYLYEGKILDMPEIGASFSFDGPQYQNGGYSFVLANDEAFHTLLARVKVDGSIGTVRAWSPGLTWANIETNGVICRGVFRLDHYTDSEIHFELADMSEHKLKALTGYYFNLNDFPDMKIAMADTGAKSSSGKIIPLVFGDWSRGVPMTNIVTYKSYSQYVVGIGPAKSVHADYRVTKWLYNYADGETGAIYTFYPAALWKPGLPLIHFVVTTGTSYEGWEPYHCGIKGIYDALGLYTDAGELVEHPADIMRWIIDNYGEYTAGQVDIAGFAAMKQIIRAARCCTWIGSNIEGRQMLDRLASQFWTAIDSTTGLSLVTFDINGPVVGRISEPEDGITDGPVIRQTSLDLIVNNLTAKYSYNANTGAYEGTLNKDYTNNKLCRDSHYSYGQRPKEELLFTDVWNESLAEQCINRFLDMRAMSHELIEWTVPWHVGWPFRQGDVAELTVDKPGWVDERAILIEKHYTEDGIRQVWWRINTT